MAKKLLILFLLLFLPLTAAACGEKKTPESAAPEQKEAGLAEKETDTNTETEGKTETEEKDSQLIIKTRNEVPDAEAEAMLEEVDRQLEELMAVFDEMEEVNQSDLDYGGDGK